MFRKKDWLVIGGALLLAAALFLGVRAGRGGLSPTGDVVIRVNGAIYETARLGAEKTLRVDQADGAVNIVRIDENGVWMEHASCKNQNCLAQGAVTADNWKGRAMGAQIVCLPNRVVVELALADMEAARIAEDLPDI